MEGPIPVLIGCAALYLLITGLIRIIRRQATVTRWRFVPPHYAAKEVIDLPGWRVALGGLIRIAIGGALVLMMVGR